METVNFSYRDFSEHRNFHPKYFNTFYSIDRKVYRDLEMECEKNDKGVTSVLESIKCRTSKEYFSKIYRAQTEAITYSEYVFPAYRFILPDTLMDDWLSVMDPHKKYCRDHSLHQPLTAYVVAKLLGYGKPNDALSIGKKDLLSICGKWLLTSSKTQYLRDYFSSLYPDCKKIPKVILKKMSMDVYYEAAVMSALFHDMGYPWQFVNRLSDSIQVADFLVHENPVVNAENILDMIGNRLLVYPFYGYSEVSRNRPISNWKARLIVLFDRSMRMTHGFPGALGFTYLQDVIRMFPRNPSLNDALFRFVMDWAAMGIMMHDMAKIYKGNKAIQESPFLRLSFETDPLSSLIATADILEEFHRPSAGFNKVNQDNIRVDFDFPCERTELTCNDGYLNISYIYKTERDVASNIRYRNEEVEDYFNPNKGFVDVSPLGIRGVRCNVLKS